ncbi:MAG: GTPase HflX, partial [Mangrovimonas sp.]|nr:GTPase HflX [Mangrovimonas sp.]MCB0469178.1 GTPase HflX [Flavobacteriaceae bacterium]
NKILLEIKSANKPTIMVFNKIDAYTPEPFDEDDLMQERTSSHYSLAEWEKTWMSKIGDNALFISALNKENLIEFKQRVYAEVRKIHITRFPYNHFLYPDPNEIS